MVLLCLSGSDVNMVTSQQKDLDSAPGLDRVLQVPLNISEVKVPDELKLYQWHCLQVKVIKKKKRRNKSKKIKKD